ncbi:hypothetical protein SNEBB_001370 [Seison nebaliae]|nr:hypothetical protein SNEBB_001370 [Seison nebaliae]
MSDNTEMNINGENNDLLVSDILQRLIGQNHKRQMFVNPQCGAFHQAPPPEQARIQKLMDSCSAKMVISGVGGVGLGAIFGIFTASIDPMSTITPAGQIKPPTTKQVFFEMKNRSISYAKNFAVLGIIFSGIECNIESYRGKQDIWNGTYAGAATGGILGFRAGVKAGIYGTIGFAGFSYLIELFLNH